MTKKKKVLIIAGIVLAAIILFFVLVIRFVGSPVNLKYFVNYLQAEKISQTDFEKYFLEDVCPLVKTAAREGNFITGGFVEKCGDGLYSNGGMYSDGSRKYYDKYGRELTGFRTYGFESKFGDSALGRFFIKKYAGQGGINTENCINFCESKSMTEFWNNLEVGQREETTKLEEVKLSTLVFSFNDAKAGNKIGGMEIVSVKPFLAGYIDFSENNVSIKFKGPVTISGKYYYAADGVVNNQYCFNGLTSESLNKVPRLENDQRVLWFCFSNEKEAQKLLGKNNGQATIVIDNYTINYYPSEVWNTADIVQVN